MCKVGLDSLEKVELFSTDVRGETRLKTRDQNIQARAGLKPLII